MGCNRCAQRVGQGGNGNVDPSVAFGVGEGTVGPGNDGVLPVLIRGQQSELVAVADFDANFSDNDGAVGFGEPTGVKKCTCASVYNRDVGTSRTLGFVRGHYLHRLVANRGGNGSHVCSVCGVEQTV